MRYREASLWQTSRHALPYEFRWRVLQSIITTMAQNIPIYIHGFTTMTAKMKKIMRIITTMTANAPAATTTTGMSTTTMMANAPAAMTTGTNTTTMTASAPAAMTTMTTGMSTTTTASAPAATTTGMNITTRRVRTA